MADLPEYKRTTGIQGTQGVEDFSGAMRDLASATWGTFGALGASVAQTASQQTAANVGYQLGLKPDGDRPLPITDFDKHVAESYHAQAYSTLSLQANQMFYDADNALKQAPYITQDLINSTNQQLTMGVEGIVNNAPMAIKGRLGATLVGQIQAQAHGYTGKMIEQDKGLALSNSKKFLTENNVNINNLNMAGNAEAAKQATEASIGVAKNAQAQGLMQPDEAAAYVKSAQDSNLGSQYRAQYGQARAQGNGAEYVKKLAEDKSLSDTDRTTALSAVFNYKTQLDNANNEYENIQVAEMRNKIALTPTLAEADMASFKEQVSPLRYQQVEHELIQAKKVEVTAGLQMSEILAGWSDPDVMARQKPETINKGFDSMTNAIVKRGQDTGNSISKDDAEVQAVASAAVPVPAFTNMLEARIMKGNPVDMQRASTQINQLRSLDATGAMKGISPLAQAIASKFENLAPYMGAEEAAKQASALGNMSNEQRNEVMGQWHNLTNISGVAPYQIALKAVGIDKSDFVNTGAALYYGSELLDVYRSNFIWAGGDNEIAKKMTTDYYKQRFGNTYVNGSEHITDNPIERSLGYKSPDVVPYIHEDAAVQLNKRFNIEKRMFDTVDNVSGKYMTDSYFEIVPPDPEQKGFFSTRYQPLQITRHFRDNAGKVQSKTYEVALNGNEGGNWDVVVNNNGHMSSLYSFDHNLGVVTYTPDKKSIDDNYRKKNHIGFAASPQGAAK